MLNKYIVEFRIWYKPIYIEATAYDQNIYIYIYIYFIIIIM